MARDPADEVRDRPYYLLESPECSGVLPITLYMHTQYPEGFDLWYRSAIQFDDDGGAGRVAVLRTDAEQPGLLWGTRKSYANCIVLGQIGGCLDGVLYGAITAMGSP